MVLAVVVAVVAVAVGSEGVSKGWVINMLVANSQVLATLLGMVPAGQKHRWGRGCCNFFYSSFINLCILRIVIFCIFTHLYDSNELPSYAMGEWGMRRIGYL